MTTHANISDIRPTRSDISANNSLITSSSLPIHAFAMYLLKPRVLVSPRRFSWQSGDDLLLAPVSKAHGRYWDTLVPPSAFNANVIVTE